MSSFGNSLLNDNGSGNSGSGQGGSSSGKEKGFSFNDDDVNEDDGEDDKSDDEPPIKLTVQEAQMMEILNSKRQEVVANLI